MLEGGHLRVFFQDGHTDQFHDPSLSGFGAKPMDFSHTAHRELLKDFVIRRSSAAIRERVGRWSLETSSTMGRESSVRANVA